MADLNKGPISKIEFEEKKKGGIVFNEIVDNFKKRKTFESPCGNSKLGKKGKVEKVEKMPSYFERLYKGSNPSSHRTH